MCSKLISRTACALFTLCLACTQPPKGEPVPQAQVVEPQQAVEPQDHASGAKAKPQSTRPAPLPLPAAVAEASASVVRVVSYSGKSSDDVIRFPYAGLSEHKRGLGVVIEEAGFILTTYSLLAREGSADLPTVVDVQGLGEGTAHVHATIVGVEPTLDLAILEAKLDGGSVRAAKLESPDPLEAGAQLFAVTSRREQSFSHVSGTVAELPSAECYQHSMTPTMMQVTLDQPLDTLGTPVFGKTGKLLAFKTRHEGLADEAETESTTHLLPIELVFNIYEALKTKRSTKSPWTGFSVRPLSVGEQGMFPVRGFKGGIALLDIWENSPAERMELNPGDILLAFGHYRIGSVADFQKWLYMHGVGHKVTLKLLRGGEVIERAYTIEERPSWAVPR